MNLSTLSQSVVRSFEEVFNLGCVSNLLSWDQEVCLPSGGTDCRSSQIELVSRITHQKLTDPKLWEAVEALEHNAAELSDDERANLEEIHRIISRQSKLPFDFVGEKARAAALSFAAWVQAKETGQFQIVRPHLEKMISLAKEEAAFVGYSAHPYDALLDIHEPGMTLNWLDTVLTPLGNELAKVLPLCVKQSGSNKLYIVSGRQQGQLRLSMRIAADLGYDFNRGRLDTSGHPFQLTLGPRDVRITTRCDSSNVLSAIFSTVHETGHALYEMGLPEAWRGQPLGAFASVGVHESQARLWENNIGRGDAFCHYLHPLIKSHFPECTIETPDGLYQCLNLVHPGPLRIGADEVTYTLHIIIRTILERELIQGRLEVQDLPDAWAALYDKYLGVSPQNNSEGILQDSHWCCGLVGYFPSYALGNIYAAMLYEKLRLDLANFDDLISKGDFSPIREWLCMNIYRHGMRYRGKELIERATGKQVSPDIFINYLKNKFCI